MGEVHLQLAVFQQRKSCELRAVVAGNGLKHPILTIREALHDRLKGFVDRLGGVIAGFDPNAHPRHALHKREDTRFSFALLADDCIDLPMAKFNAKLNDFGGVLRCFDRDFSYFHGLFWLSYCDAASLAGRCF